MLVSCLPPHVLVARQLTPSPWCISFPEHEWHILFLSASQRLETCLCSSLCIGPTLPAVSIAAHTDAGVCVWGGVNHRRWSLLIMLLNLNNEVMWPLMITIHNHTQHCLTTCLQFATSETACLEHRVHINVHMASQVSWQAPSSAAATRSYG